MSLTAGANVSPSRAVALGLVLVAPAALFFLANILNVALILGVGLMLAFFVAYVFVENYAIVQTHLE